MKISINWLKEYVEIREKPTRLRDDLTMLGILTESISEVEGNTVLELEVTSNRPDCLSHYGIAREVAALYKRRLKSPARARTLSPKGAEAPYRITIRDPRHCPRYTGLLMGGVRVAESPGWMRRRLLAAGLRPLNNIVDITNYVLLELGHPLHAFDFRRIRGGRIVVARARRGQRMTTLDGIVRELDEEMLLINDGEGPVAIGGVMGGLESEIRDDTDTVLLECAYFQPASVRRTAKKLGLSTEASYRFERGANWGDTVEAISRTCRLIQEIAGGRVIGGVQDVYPRVIQAPRISLRKARAEQLIGASLTDGFIVQTLRRLGFAPESKGSGHWHVTAPPHRPDMELEADLIEEVARFHGYQRIPSTLPPARSVGAGSPVSRYETEAREILLGLGYHESINLSFALDEDHRQFPPDGGQRIEIVNPLTQDTRFLRATLVPGLLRSAKRNFNHGMRSVRLFEIGKVFREASDKKDRERNTLGILGTGDFASTNWHHPVSAYDYFHLKGTVTTLLTSLRSAGFEIEATPGYPWLNPANASHLIVAGERLGVLGGLHPDLEEEYKLRQPLYVAEIDLEPLLRHLDGAMEYHRLPKYPSVQRDLSIAVERELRFDSIRKGIESLGIVSLVGIELIDVYEGEKIAAGKVGITLRLTYQDLAGTLTVDQVQSFGDNILNFLRSSCGAELR